MIYFSVEGGLCLTCNCNCDQEQWQDQTTVRQLPLLYIKPYSSIVSAQDSLPSDCQYWNGSCSDDLSYCLLYCSGPTIPFTLLVEYKDQEFNSSQY